jgi:hypothetical protein
MSRPPLKPDGMAPTPNDQLSLDPVIAEGEADPAAVRTLRCKTVAQGRLSQLNYKHAHQPGGRRPRGAAACTVGDHHWAERDIRAGDARGGGPSSVCEAQAAGAVIKN